MQLLTNFAEMASIALDNVRLLNAAEEELATLSSHLDAATYRQLVLIRQLDESGHWASAGATSCAAWLSWRIAPSRRSTIRPANAARRRCLRCRRFPFRPKPSCPSCC